MASKVFFACLGVVLAGVAAAEDSDVSIETEDGNVYITLTEPGKTVFVTAPNQPRVDLLDMAMRLKTLEDLVASESGKKTEKLKEISTRLDNMEDDIESLNVNKIPSIQVMNATLQGVVERSEGIASSYQTKASADIKFATKDFVNGEVKALGEGISDLDSLVDRLANITDNHDALRDQVKSIAPCDKAPAATGGTVTKTGRHNTPGMVAEHTCSDGFALKDLTDDVGDDGRRVCASSGNWIASNGEDTAPTCKKLECTTFQVETNSQVGQLLSCCASRVGDRDIRSGNPGQDTTWRLGPFNAVAVQNIKFQYEYVVGYNRCGIAKVVNGADCDERGLNGPEMTVKVVDADNDDTAETVYTSGKLSDYSYDTSGANGGWGVTSVVGDGAYSPPITVDVEVGSISGVSRVYVDFEFKNNGRNMHLNPHNMGLELQICKP